jgi:CRISPR-associated protein (TIGR02710 family)
LARGYRREQIAVNYTAGTKVMGAGAVLSAVYNKVMELRYITGLATPGDRPQPVRHRIVTTRPGAVFAYQSLLNGRNMLLDLRYRSALDVLRGIDEEILSPSDQHNQAALIKLTQAYDAWDNFQYGLFLIRYDDVTFNGDYLAAFRLDDEQHDRVRSVAQETADGKIGPHIISDIFNNADRRLLVGRIEDAMSRLYRGLEMLAQWILLRDHDIDTNDVDTRKIPPRDRVALEALRSMEDGLVKIGLRKSFDLLKILGARVGQVFDQDPVLRQFLALRSGSILAHGLHSVSRSDGERFMHHSRSVFQIEIEHFDELTRQMQFPWLRDRRHDASTDPDQVRGE